MGEFAIFTEEVAVALIENGFILRGKSKLAWFFDDSREIERFLEKYFE